VNILVIRLRLIGDVVQTTPLLRALRRKYPASTLTYLIEPTAAPIVRRNPHLSSVVVVPKGRGLTRLRQDVALARSLRREKFDIVIDCHGGPRAAWFALASGAPTRIGYDVTGRAWIYTHVVRRTAEQVFAHVERRKSFVYGSHGDFARPIASADAALRELQLGSTPVFSDAAFQAGGIAHEMLREPFVAPDQRYLGMSEQPDVITDQNLLVEHAHGRLRDNFPGIYRRFDGWRRGGTGS